MMPSCGKVECVIGTSARKADSHPLCQCYVGSVTGPLLPPQAFLDGLCQSSEAAAHVHIRLLYPRM